MTRTSAEPTRSRPSEFKGRGRANLNGTHESWQANGSELDLHVRSDGFTDGVTNGVKDASNSMGVRTMSGGTPTKGSTVITDGQVVARSEEPAGTVPGSLTYLLIYAVPTCRHAGSSACSPSNRTCKACAVCTATHYFRAPICAGCFPSCSVDLNLNYFVVAFATKK